MASGAAFPTFLPVPRPPAPSLPAAIILHLPCKGLAIPPFHHHSVSSLLPLLKFNLEAVLGVWEAPRCVLTHACSITLLSGASERHHPFLQPKGAWHGRMYSPGMRQRDSNSRGLKPPGNLPQHPNTYSAAPIHNPAPQMAPAWGRSWTDSPFLCHRYFGNDISWIILVCFTSWSCEQREFLFFLLTTLHNIVLSCIHTAGGKTSLSKYLILAISF